MNSRLDLHSLSARITTRIMLTVLIIFIIITLIVVSVTAWWTIHICTENVKNRLDSSNQYITSTLEKVEIIVDNMVPKVEESLKNPDDLYNIVWQTLELNPFIIGSAIAFEPNYFIEKGVQFSPYAYRGKDSIIYTKQLGTPEYEYHYMDWYQIPKLLKRNYWSEPYYDKYGGEDMMITFSRPVYDNTGKMYAIITADVSLEWLTKIVSQNDIDFNKRFILLTDNSKEKDPEFYYNHAYSFIIGRGGTYIAHPEHQRLLNETYFSYSAETEDTSDELAGYHMIDQEKGMTTVNRDGTNFTLIYAPIERTGWSMSTVIPTKMLTMTAFYFGGAIILIMLVGLIFLFIVCRSTVKRITRPLAHFAKSADEIAKGNFNTLLPEINTHDEMSKLRDSFLLMQKSLTDNLEKLKNVNEQKGRIEGELQAAKNIQMSMVPESFPAFPTRDDIDIYAKLTPAKEVGGDLYDFYIRNEKLFFCIGDVSGKGIPASLVMAVTLAMLRTVSAPEKSPARILKSISDTLSEANENMMFITLFVGILDLPTGKLSYCNGGHCNPLVVNSKVSLLPSIPNIPVGIESYNFEQQEVLISPGTTLFLYTDGLTEAEDTEACLFGEHRVLETAKRSIENNSVTPHKFIDDMEKSVNDFVNGAEQNDDRTMLAIHYSKKDEETRLQRSLTLSNDIERIPELSKFIEGVCEELELGMPETMSLNLALEEAVVNVMNYAYPKGAYGEVNIEAIANNKCLKIIIKDSGIPFDPTKQGEVDTTLSAEERPIGGLGIYLVREIMDSVNYEYVDHKNILTLRKNL